MDETRIRLFQLSFDDSLNDDFQDCRGLRTEFDLVRELDERVGLRYVPSESVYIG